MSRHETHPPCYQCTKPPFFCPAHGSSSPEPSMPAAGSSCPDPCRIFRGRESEKHSPPPTFCIAGPCPVPVSGKPSCSSPPPKMKPPRTSVRFCIQTTCEGSTYCPCYKADMPCCSSKY